MLLAGLPENVTIPSALRIYTKCARYRNEKVRKINVIDLKTHPYAHIFPPMNQDDMSFGDFCESVRSQGIKVPIVLYKGQILDGRHRYYVYTQYPEEIELRTEEFTGTEQQALQFVLALNKDRRNLNESQRALAAYNYSRLESMLDMKADVAQTLSIDLFRASKKMVEIVAEIHNDKRHTLDNKRLLIKSIEKGMPATAVNQLRKGLSPQLWEKAIEESIGGNRKYAQAMIKAAKRQEREVELAHKTVAANRELTDTEMVYGVIYSDPPWHFEVRSENGMDRSAENHYPTMSLDDIRGLKIPAAKDCALFMWVTTPHLSNGIEILEGWGFDYKTCYVWNKHTPGTGYWTRNMVELLLLGIKGEVPAPLPDQMMPQLVGAMKTKHSEKPEVFADGITKMFPNVAKLEMFSRGIKHKGEHWFYHGNESGVEIEPTEAKPVTNGKRTRKAKETTETIEEVKQNENATQGEDRV